MPESRLIELDSDSSLLTATGLVWPTVFRTTWWAPCSWLILMSYWWALSRAENGCGSNFFIWLRSAGGSENLNFFCPENLGNCLVCDVNAECG